MAERRRVLLEAAIVSAVVGGTAAAIVTKLSGSNDDARVQERVRERERPAPSTTATPSAAPSAIASAVPPPAPIEPVTDAAAPPSDEALSFPDLLASIDWAAPVDVTGVLDSGPPSHADAESAPVEAKAHVEVDAGVTPIDEAHAHEAPHVIASRPPAPTGSTGLFSTEAPPWAASAWTTDPNAGAGPFVTDGWAASALMPTPQAGAGPFITEQRGFIFYRGFFVLPFPRAIEDGEGAGEGLQFGEGAEGADGAEDNGPFEPFEPPPPFELPTND